MTTALAKIGNDADAACVGPGATILKPTPCSETRSCAVRAALTHCLLRSSQHGPDHQPSGPPALSRAVLLPLHSRVGAGRRFQPHAQALARERATIPSRGTAQGRPGPFSAGWDEMR
eukprot:3123592-Rhodomonas_salina.2